jgi:hypothetical protein
MVDPDGSAPNLIRILVTDVSDSFYTMLVGLVGARPDVVLVGRVTGRVELLLAVDAGIDIVVIGAPQRKPPPGIFSHLLSEYPDLKVLVLANDTGKLDVYWRGLRRRRMGSLSEAALFDCLGDL